MSIVVRFAPGDATTEQYDQVLRRLEESDNWPPDGLDYHVAFGSTGDLRVSEIWDSQEQFEAFGQHLMPLLADAGIELTSEPELFEVHNVVKR
ncbi:MAG: hypothetical protein ICV74_07925 [Thermoleophilia bacterium]|nr:hypothetical protein [Thermoleophilia bacterium]